MNGETQKFTRALMKCDSRYQNPSKILSKPEPIMLLILPNFPIIFTHYSLFIPMLSPIILYYHIAGFFDGCKFSLFNFSWVDILAFGTTLHRICIVEEILVKLILAL